MTYGFDTPPNRGSEVCPVCSEIYPAAQPNCPKCGHVRGTVADPNSEQPTRAPVYIASAGSPGRNWAALAAVLLTLFGGGIALFVALDVRERVSSALDNVFVPDDVGSVSTDDSSDELSPATCRKRLTRYLRRLFFALDGVDTSSTSQAFLDAAAEFGPGSQMYRRLVDIYSTFELNSLAVQGRPRDALKKATSRIQRACR
jgi:hypothetical protein